MTARTVQRKLTWLAELASTPERRVSPMRIAAPLLEDTVEQRPADPPQS